MFKNTGFRRQLTIVFSAGIFLLALATTFVVSNVSKQALRDRIIGEGIKLAEVFASQSSLALLYASEQNAKEVASVITNFDDVIGVEILDRNFTSLYQEGSKMKTHESIENYSKTTILNSNDTYVWEIISPVILVNEEYEEADPSMLTHTEKELLGYVKILISQSSMRKMANKIFWYNLILSVSLAAILLIILLAISRRLINPINRLANIMKSAQQRKIIPHVELGGPPDIREMFEAFNSMMEILQQREKELQKSRDEAVILAQLKGEFAANVSHELRTPMNGVLGMLDMLGDGGLSGKQREYLTVAQNSARSLLSLINDILDFSKNESGKAILELAEFNLMESLEEIIALLGTQTRSKRIDFAYLIDKDVPCHLIGDMNRIRQILMNLVSNAIKFTEAGHVSIEVSLVKESQQSAEDTVDLKFRVIDSGIGIVEEMQNHIFEAFSQADGSTTRKFGGTGLGLAICKQLVELLGGEIDVESEPDKGSCFWFTLPFKKLNTPSSAGISSATYEKLNALIVDTNSIVRRSLESMLDRLQIKHSSASDYNQAIKVIDSNRDKGNHFDFLVVDEQNNEGQCSSLVQHLNASQNNKIPCLVLVQRGAEPELVPRKNNKQVFISKPVLYSHIVSAVGILFGTSRQEGQTKDVQNTVTHTFPGARLLVVDDNPVNLLVALGMIKPLGSETDTATNGIECLAKLAEKDYDLIFMDCNMPEMDGYKASQIIRERESNDEHTIIVAITANAGVGDREKCIASGMDDYLVKPFTRDDIRAKLVHWLPDKKKSG